MDIVLFLFTLSEHRRASGDQNRLNDKTDTVFNQSSSGLSACAQGLISRDITYGVTYFELNPGQSYLHGHPKNYINF